MPAKEKDCWKAAGILHLHPRRKGFYRIFSNIVRQRDARMGDLRFLCSQKDQRSEPIFSRVFSLGNDIIYEVKDMSNFILRFLKLDLLLWLRYSDGKYNKIIKFFTVSFVLRWFCVCHLRSNSILVRMLGGHTVTDFKPLTVHCLADY